MIKPTQVWTGDEGQEKEATPEEEAPSYTRLSRLSGETPGRHKELRFNGEDRNMNCELMMEYKWDIHPQIFYSLMKHPFVSSYRVL